MSLSSPDHHPEVEPEENVSNDSDDSNDEEELEAELEALRRIKTHKERKPTFIDSQGCLDKLEDIKLKTNDGKPLPWIELLQITPPEPTLIENVQDDLKREQAFYEKALEATKMGLQRFEELGINYKRPDDYFAEMIKSDEHMRKVKKVLMDEKKRLEAVEERKKQRQMKKFGKILQQEKQKEKQKEKKQSIESVTKWRKSREKGNISETEFPIKLEKGEKDEKFATKAPAKKSKKRAYKDQLYGYGGKKRGKKSNTAESVDDLSDFSLAKNKQVPKELMKKMPQKGKKAPKKKRPGKNQRKKKK